MRCRKRQYRRDVRHRVSANVRPRRPRSAVKFLAGFSHYLVWNAIVTVTTPADQLAVFANAAACLGTERCQAAVEVNRREPGGQVGGQLEPRCALVIRMRMCISRRVTSATRVTHRNPRSPALVLHGFRG